MAQAKAAEVVGSELALRDSTSLAALDDFDAILRGLKEPNEVVADPAEIQREILNRLLTAETDEELENFGEATSWSNELLDVPVEIYGFRWMKSDIDQKEGSLPVYVLVDLTRLDTGDRLVCTIGSGNVMAQLSNLARRERFPAIRSLKMLEKATKSGFHPLMLVTPPEEKVRLARSLADTSNPLDEV